MRLPRRRLLRVALIAIGLWILLCGGVALFVFATGDQFDAQPSDAIIVLGAGLRRNGNPGDALYRRSLIAAQAYSEGYAPIIICTGGQDDYATRTEAEGCRDVLLAEGVPSDAIILEDQSRSTEQNAINTLEIMRANGWQTAVIVTDSYHMPRASWIFSNTGVAHTRYPVPRSRIRTSWYALSVTREILAFHWYAFKGLFGLPFTDFNL